MEDCQQESLTEDLAAQFQYTIEMSQEAVFWLERNGQFSYVNDQACRSLGYTRDELLSLFLWDVDFDFQRDQWRDHWNNLQKTEKINLETTHRRKDGHTFPVEVSAFQMTFKGKEFHAAFVRDITERKLASDVLKKSESLYRSLFEHVPDGILVANQESYYLDANPKMCRMLGYQHDELVGMNATDIVSLLETEYIKPALAQIKSENKHSRTWLFSRKDGSIFEAEVNVTRMPDNNLLALVRDITDRKKLEAMLAQAQKMEAIGTLAGGIAHDFNNILSAVIGYTEIALDHQLQDNSSARESLENVLKAGFRARDLIKQILTFSRQTKHEKKLLTLGPILIEADKFLRALLPSNIEISLDDQLGNETILGDPVQIHQSIINLCTNSEYAMRANGGNLSIGALIVKFTDKSADKPAKLGPGTYIKLTVSDTGSGMEPFVLEKIFDPFFTTKPKEEGTGLGLSVVHGIVMDHRGEILVSSKPKKGTIFTIYLPRAESVAEKVEVEAMNPLPFTGGDEQILVIDDNPSVADVTGEMLASAGYKVTVETDSLKAVEIFSKTPDSFDLVLTDQTMPGLTGNQLAAKLLSIRPDIPVILCSGYNDIIDETRAKGIGIKQYLMKPLSLTDLAASVRNVLDNQKHG